MKGTHQGRKGNKPLKWDGKSDSLDAAKKRRRRRNLRRGIKRVSVYKRCKGKCVDCGIDVPFDGAEIHHIKALSDGGLNQVFCGASDDGHTRVDIRKESAANLIGHFQVVPLERIYRSAFADPPYTQEFANKWGVKCPKPSEILKVMVRSCLPGSILGILHLQVIRPIKGLEKIAWHPVFCGTTKHIRCLSVFRIPEEK